MRNYFKYTILLEGLMVGIGLIFLLNPTSLHANTCQPISGGAEFEYLCTPRSNTPNCTPEGSNNSICQGMPDGYSTQPVGEIFINPTSIEKGKSATLSWSVSGTKDCTISNTYKADAAGGSVAVKPEADGTFTLRCRGFDAEGNSTGNYIPIDSVNFTVTSLPEEEETPPPPLTELVNTNLPYVPLEPLVGVNQGGDASFGALIKGYFRILVNIGAFLAVAVLVVGGITYMVSESVASKFVGKERVKAAFIGLGILAAAWLILNTINPQLLEFNRDFLAPADPVLVDRRTNFEKDGVGERNLTGKQVRAIEKEFECPEGSGSDCVWGKALIFQNDKKNTSRVANAIEEYRSACKGWRGALSAWHPKARPGSFIDGPKNTTVHVCVATGLIGKD